MSHSNEGLDILLKRQQPPMRQRRQRTNFNESQIEYLDKMFTKNPYPDINEREELAASMQTSEDRIQVWFQNKRARYRKKMNKNNENSEPMVTTTTKPKQSKKLMTETDKSSNSSFNDSGYQSTPMTSFCYSPPQQFSSPFHSIAAVAMFHNSQQQYYYPISSPICIPTVNSQQTRSTVFRPFE